MPEVLAPTERLCSSTVPATSPTVYLRSDTVLSFIAVRVQHRNDVDAALVDEVPDRRLERTLSRGEQGDPARGVRPRLALQLDCRRERTRGGGVVRGERREEQAGSGSDSCSCASSASRAIAPAKIALTERLSYVRLPSRSASRSSDRSICRLSSAACGPAPGSATARAPTATDRRRYSPSSSNAKRCSSREGM
jgi:hypothetical protein